MRTHTPVVAISGAILGSLAVSTYAYRERIRDALIPRVIGPRTIIANCVFDGSVTCRAPLDYCKGNTFNSTGLTIQGNP